MTIEKDLKDNTAALKANTEILQKLYNLKSAGLTAVPTAQPAAVAAPAAAPIAEQPAPAAPNAPAAVAQPAAVAAPVPAIPAAAPVPSGAVKSAEEMNTMLVAEFKRIGDRAPIDAAMQSLGVISVTDLPAEKQQELINAVAAIPSVS